MFNSFKQNDFKKTMALKILQTKIEQIKNLKEMIEKQKKND